MENEIPDDVARNIQARVDRKKTELEKKAKEEEKQRKERAKAEKELQADRKKTIESAKKNLLSLNEFIRKEPLKSYLNLEKTTSFPLWESRYGTYNAELFLRSDGVYKWASNLKKSFRKTYKNVVRITPNSLTTDALNSPDLSDLPDYIWSLEKWNSEKIIKYLREQFTPI